MISRKTIGYLILNYLRWAARLQLSKNPHATIIGITGSAGKTSTRLAIVSILKHKGQVKHSAHANSESGIPLNILGIKVINYSMLDWLRIIILVPFKLLFNHEKFDYYVVEMGIDSPKPPKNMDYLLSIIKPHIGIVLNAGLVHGESFDYLVKDRNPLRRQAKVKAVIAQEKMKLVHALAPEGVAIVNYDQKELIKNLKNLRSRKLTFGFSSQAQLHLTKLKLAPVFNLSLEYQSQKFDLTLPDIYEEGYAYTFAAALATAAAVGVSPHIAIQYLQQFRAPRGRMRVFEGINQTHLIDSSYNASPDTMRASLNFLAKVAGRKKKLAILGDMRELGAETKLAHKILADLIKSNCDECLLFGESTFTHTLPVLQSANFPVRHFETMSTLIAYAKSKLKPGMWVLIKGSQNKIFLERAVEGLLSDPADSVHLCRRGVYWDKLRKATP